MLTRRPLILLSGANRNGGGSLCRDLPRNLLVGHLLLVGNGKAVDAKEVADARGDQPSPARVDDERKHQVSPKVKVLELRGDSRKSKAGKVSDEGTSHQRPEHDSPEGEGLLGEMSENHLGGHAAKDEAHANTEEHQVVLGHQCRVWAIEPGTNAEGKNDDRSPLEEDRKKRLVARQASIDDIDDAERNVEEHGANQEVDPNVLERGVAQVLFGQPEEAEQVEVIGQSFGPDFRAIPPADRHQQAGDKNSFRRSVDVSEVEGMCVICFPGREPHGQAGAQRSEDTGLGSAQTHSGGFEQASECAVETVDAMVEELSQAAGGSGASRLFAVDIVHRLVRKEAESEAEI